MEEHLVPVGKIFLIHDGQSVLARGVATGSGTHVCIFSYRGNTVHIFDTEADCQGFVSDNHLTTANA